jgi:hypothetical protein
MPQAVPALIVAAGQAIAGVAVAKIFVAFVVNVALSYLSEALSDRPRDPGRPPTNVTINDTVEHRHLVIGTRRVGGSFVFVRTSGDGNKFLWYVIAYADHQCNDLKDAWFDEFHVPDADINAGTGAVATSWANGKVWIWSHLGTQAQTADAQLTAAFTTGADYIKWESTDRLRGVCYRVIKMEHDDTAFPTGAPSHVSSLVEGALLYDSRLDTTNGGSGAHRMDNPSTWAFSNNWALGVLWLLTGGSVVNDQATRIVKYGIKEDYARIDWPFWAAAANISDEDLTGANTTPDGDQVRYTLDMEATTAQERREILDLAIRAGAGELVYVHGKWRLYAGAYDTPVHSFDQDDLRGDMEVEDTTDEEERVNRVAGIYLDAGQNYKEQTTPYRFNAAYDTQDGGREFPQEIDLRALTDGYRAQRVCELELRKARQMRRVVFRFGRNGMKVAPHETFYFSHTRLGWVNREWRCVKKRRERTQDGGIITVITARSEDASIYTDLVTADYETGTSVTNAIQSETPEAPTALTVTPRSFGLEFNWTLGTFWTLNGITELWEHTASTPFASATKIWEGRGSRVVLGKSDTVARYYWVRVRTIGGQTSTTFPATTGTEGRATNTNGGWHVDALGKPRGIRASESIADRTQIQFGGAGIQILSTPNTTVGYGFPAIPIDASATYQLRIRHKSSASSSDGLYLRFNEINTALPLGKTHIGFDDGAGLDSATTARTSSVDLVANGPMPGTTMVESVYTYTPTATVDFASFSMYNYDPATASVVYEVEWVRLTRTDSNVNLLSTGGAGATEDLVPNAATDVESVEDDTASLTNGGGVVLSKSLSEVAISYLLQATATMDVWITNNGGGTPTFQIVVTNGSTLVTSQESVPSATTSPGQRITLQCEVEIDPADEPSLEVQVTWTGAQPTGTAEVRNAALRCEKIKR